MTKLSDIYTSIQNPLNDEKSLSQIIEAYTKSSRTNFIGVTNLYDYLVKMSGKEDNSEVNQIDRAKFLISTYNQWIKNMVNLDELQINYLESHKGMDARAMQQYLRNFGEVKTVKDLKRLKSSPLFDKEINSWELFNGWSHIKSQYISARKEGKISVKHRLYVGCQNQDMWKLAQLFKTKCEEQQIPFYFKIKDSKDRDDKMVIYADTNNLANYLDALKEIGRENPDIIQRCGKPPLMTGKIDGWIGIGDEPAKNGEKGNSYNELRAKILEDAIEETILMDIMKLKGKDFNYNGRQINFNEVFIAKATQTILNKLETNKNKTSFLDTGLRKEELSNPKVTQHIKMHTRKHIQEGLNKLFEVKDKKDKILKDNYDTIFSIPTRGDKGIDISIYDMDMIIKDMVPIIRKINPNFIEEVKIRIQEKSKENGLDDTFCFQQGTKEKFEKMDLIRLKDKPPIQPELKQETAITPAQKQELRMKREMRKQNKEEKEEYRGTKISAEKNRDEKKLLMKELKETIEKGEATLEEMKNLQKEIAELKEIRQIFFLGNRATEEQRKRLQELTNKHHRGEEQGKKQGQGIDI